MKQLIIRLKKNNVKKFDISGPMNNSNLDKKNSSTSNKAEEKAEQKI